MNIVTESAEMGKVLMIHQTAQKRALIQEECHLRLGFLVTHLHKYNEADGSMNELVRPIIMC